MAYPGAADDFRACVEGRAPRRVPVFGLGQEVNQRLAGLTCGQYRRDVDGLVQSELDAVARFGYDWVMVFPDDYVEFEHLGLGMRDDDDHPAMPAHPLPLTADTLRRFRTPDATAEGRMPTHLEMIRRLKRALGDTACVFGRIAAPFSAGALVYGIEPWLTGMLDDPDLLRANTRFFEEHQAAFARAQIEAGADALWVGDCVADSAFIREDHYARFAFDAAAVSIDAITRAGGVSIYHTGETAPGHLRRQMQLPPCAINIGEGICIVDVKETGTNGHCLTGNLDPVLLRDGHPDAIATAADAMVRANLAGGGYVFSTGEGVMYTTPETNVAAMMRAARQATDDAAPPST